MSKVIELKDEIYIKLKEHAEKDGVTPEVWIEVKIQSRSDFEVKLNPAKKKRKKWHSFVGVVDSSSTSLKDKPKNEVIGDGVIEKMRRIGLNVPE